MKTRADTWRALAISNSRSVQRDHGPQRAPFLFQVGLLGVESKGSKEENGKERKKRESGTLTFYEAIAFIF